MTKPTKNTKPGATPTTRKVTVEVPEELFAGATAQDVKDITKLIQLSVKTRLLNRSVNALMGAVC